MAAARAIGYQQSMTDPHDDALPDALFLVEIEDPDADGGLRRTFSFSRSTPVLVNFAANRFTRASSRLYQRRFGIGAADWRLLVLLTRMPGAGVSAAARTMGVDKAAVSRSLVRLEARGLVAAEAAGRRRSFRLTPEGVALHARIMRIALARQKRILQGFSEDEIARFNDYLRRFIANHDAMEDAPPTEGPAMQIEIWHNPRCSKSRETLALLEAKGHAPVVRRYLETPPGAQELLAAAALIGTPLHALARKKEAEWAALGLSETTPPAELAAAMAAHPKLIERPVVFAGGRAALGRPPQAALDALGL